MRRRVDIPKNMKIASCGRIFEDKNILKTQNEGLQLLFKHIQKLEKLIVIWERYVKKMLVVRYIKCRKVHQMYIDLIKIWLCVYKQHFRSRIWFLGLQPINSSNFWICLNSNCNPSFYVFRIFLSSKMRPQEAIFMFFWYIYSSSQ